MTDDTEAPYPPETVTLTYSNRAGGVAWRASVSETTDVASGWGRTVAEARIEACERGIITAVRWFNPRGESPSE